MKRIVAEALVTCTSVEREFGESMVAEPDTRVHVVDETASPGAGVAVPLRVNVVDAPSEHLL